MDINTLKNFDNKITELEKQLKELESQNKESKGSYGNRIGVIKIFSNPNSETGVYNTLETVGITCEDTIDLSKYKDLFNEAFTKTIQHLVEYHIKRYENGKYFTYIPKIGAVPSVRVEFSGIDGSIVSDFWDVDENYLMQKTNLKSLFSNLDMEIGYEEFLNINEVKKRYDSELDSLAFEVVKNLRNE